MKCLIKLYHKRINNLPKHSCGKDIEGANDNEDDVLKPQLVLGEVMA